jgi:hypothetical protein
MSDHITAGDMEKVKAMFPVSKDVETLSLGGNSVLKTTGTIPASCEAGPDHNSTAQGKFLNERATDIRRARKARGKANLFPEGASASSELERGFGDGTLGQIQAQAGLGQKFRVVVTSYRKRLLDEDNLCEKYLVDLCRYIGALPKDSPGTATIEVKQEKIQSNEEEKCLIEIYQL